MVNKLTNSEIAKVFAMYWGCKYLATDGVKLNMTGYGIEFAHEYEHKLLLKPLSDITDEDANYIFNVATQATGTMEDVKWDIKRGDDCVIGNYRQLRCFLWFDLDQVLVDIIGQTEVSYNSAAVFQFLVTKGYAVPLYFGIGHWANGKTAIQLGIAIDKKTLSDRP